MFRKYPRCNGSESFEWVTSVYNLRLAIKLTASGVATDVPSAYFHRPDHLRSVLVSSSCGSNGMSDGQQDETRSPSIIKLLSSGRFGGVKMEGASKPRQAWVYRTSYSLAGKAVGLRLPEFAAAATNVVVDAYLAIIWLISRLNTGNPKDMDTISALTSSKAEQRAFATGQYVSPTYSMNSPTFTTLPSISLSLANDLSVLAILAT